MYQYYLHIMNKKVETENQSLHVNKGRTGIQTQDSA
jgi:hypothetical protein